MIEITKEDSGRYFAKIQEWPVCCAEGATRIEALRNLVYSACDYARACQQTGVRIPEVFEELVAPRPAARRFRRRRGGGKEATAVILGELNTVLTRAEAEREQLRVQLAGCSVAALGGATGCNDAKQGDYGWSPAFQAVKGLRAERDALSKRVEAAVAALNRIERGIFGPNSDAVKVARAALKERRAKEVGSNAQRERNDPQVESADSGVESKGG